MANNCMCRRSSNNVRESFSEIVLLDSWLRRYLVQSSVPQVHLPSQLSILSGFWRIALMIQDIYMSDLQKRSWTSCIPAVLSRAPSSSPAPRSQRACVEKVQKSLQRFVKTSAVTAQVQSNGSAHELTPVLPENVKLPAQGWCTCSVSAVRWGEGHCAEQHPVCCACPGSSQVAFAALLEVSFWRLYLLKKLTLFIASFGRSFLGCFCLSNR